MINRQTYVGFYKSYNSKAVRRKKKSKFDTTLVLDSQGLERLAWDALAKNRNLICKKDPRKNSRKVQNITQYLF